MAKKKASTEPAPVALSKHQKRVMRRMVAGAPVFSRTDCFGGVMRLGQSADSFKPVGKKTLEVLEAAGLVRRRQEARMLVWTPTEDGRNKPHLIRAD